MTSALCPVPSFKYGSDDENSSVTSGSGYGALQSSPHSTSQNASQSLGVTTQAVLEDMAQVKESNQRVEDSLARLMEEFDAYKVHLSVCLSVCLLFPFFCL